MIAPKPLPPETNDAPDVPGLRTWRGVYWFVFGCFVVVVIALTWFAHRFA